jgi:hypothetical protein
VEYVIIITIVMVIGTGVVSVLISSVGNAGPNTNIESQKAAWIVGTPGGISIIDYAMLRDPNTHQLMLKVVIKSRERITLNIFRFSRLTGNMIEEADIWTGTQKFSAGATHTIIIDNVNTSVCVGDQDWWTYAVPEQTLIQYVTSSGITKQEQALVLSGPCPPQIA